VLCIAGDGGVMLNSQELLTIGANKLPIKVFIFNNDGYGSIKATQDNLFNSRYVGANPQSNVFNPDFQNLAAAYRLGYSKLLEHSDLDEVLGRVLASDEPEVCEVMLSSEQWISPKASTFRNAEGKLESKPLDDMYPFLPEEEIKHNRSLADAIY
uniref:thiamine pyrophosphate-dependent enzyme n=1 Tax=Chromobacterium sp. ASV23 TaxID=2795110 RepID=UPI001E2F7DD1